MKTEMTREELEVELDKLRAAIVILANSMGSHILSAVSIKELQELLKGPND